MATRKVIEIDVDSKKAQQGIEGLSKTVNEETDSMSDSLGGFTDELDSLSGGLLSKFKSLKGTLGNVAGGFKSIGVAVAASGIGLLVITIGAVIAAFKSSEEGQNKFAKLMGVIGSVVGNLMDVFSDFGESVIEAFENPQKAWTSFKESLNSGYQFIKGQIIDRFSSAWTILSGGIESGILKMRVAWNEFTGDSEEAEELTKQLEIVQREIDAATDKINQRNQEIVNGFNAAIGKVKEFAAEVEKDAEKAAKIADQRANADKVERNLIVARAKANRDIAALREKAVDKENFQLEERIKFLEEASNIETRITNAEIHAAGLRLNAKRAENSLSKSTKEDLDEEAQLQANLIDLQTQRLQKQKEITTEVQGLRAQEQAELDAELKLKEEQIEKEKAIELQRLEAIQAIKDEFKEKQAELDAESETELLELEQEKRLAELEALKADEEAKAQVKAFYDDLITQAEEDESKKRIQNALAEKRAKADIFNAQADLAIGFGQLLQQVGEENKALAITGIIVEQVASIAKIISNTAVANASAAASFPLTGGMPFVAINTVAAGLGIASSIAGATKAISQLGGSGGGASASAGATAAPASPAPPAFNVVGESPESQLAQQLANESDTPVRAYVVSKEVSDNQELDRNIEDTASF